MFSSEVKKRKPSIWRHIKWILLPVASTHGFALSNIDWCCQPHRVPAALWDSFISREKLHHLKTTLGNIRKGISAEVGQHHQPYEDLRRPQLQKSTDYCVQLLLISHCPARHSRFRFDDMLSLSSIQWDFINVCSSEYCFIVLLLRWNTISGRLEPIAASTGFIGYLKILCVFLSILAQAFWTIAAAPKTNRTARPAEAWAAADGRFLLPRRGLPMLQPPVSQSFWQL